MSTQWLRVRAARSNRGNEEPAGKGPTTSETTLILTFGQTLKMSMCGLAAERWVHVVAGYG